MMIKLADWCKKHGIKYLTGYRWFKDGKMPVDAYQTDTGTILVSDEDDALDTLETNMPDNRRSGDSPVAQIIKKAVEISKAGAPVEDLATFVISNFDLQNHEVAAAPVARRARMKPTSEMTSSHFKKFMKSSPKPDANMFLVNQGDLDNVVAASEKVSSIEGALGVEFAGAQNFGTVVPSSAALSNPQVQTIASAMNTAMQPLPKTNLVATPKTYTSVESGAVFTRSLVDGGAVATNSTLSAAIAAAPSVSVFSASALPSMTNSAFYTSDISGATVDDYSAPVFTNEAQVYNPVTYDEARALLSITSDITDTLTLDRRAKQLCLLDRETFDGLVKSAQANRK